MIIKAYIGVIGSGKDYRCKNECTHKVSFADELRKDVWKILGWEPKTDEEYEHFKVAQYFTPSGNFTGREILQNYGSLMKELHGEDYWAVRAAKKIVQLYNQNKNCIVGIPDCRYSVEIEYLICVFQTNNTKVEFLHCDYKSDRYNAVDPHHSEHLAQQFAGKVYAQREFNDLIYKMYGT